MIALAKRSVSFSPVPDGFLEVWEEPVDGEVYVGGADVAEGLAHGDYSVADIIKVSTGEQVAKWHGHMEADLFAKCFHDLGIWYNHALLCPEANNHGLTVITVLRQMNYPRLFRRKSLNDVNRSTSTQFGWLTTRTSKPLMIDELGAALREELDVRSEGTCRELLSYQINDRGHYEGAPFDDCVMSLAIANQMRKYAHLPEYSPKREQMYSFDWWSRQGEMADRKVFRIGSHSGRRQLV